MELSKDKEVSNAGQWQTLESKYSIRVKTLGVVIEELKQRIVAIAGKVRWYQERVDGLDKVECSRIIRGSFIGN